MSVDILVNPEKGAIYVNGFRVLLRHAYIFQSMKREMERLVGASAGFLFHKAGKDASLIVPVENGSLESSVESLTWLGLGKYTLKKENKNRIIVEARETPFSTGFVKKFGKRKTPFCHYIAGVLEGLAERSTRRKSRCVEISCVTRGDDKCRFSIEIEDSPSNWDFDEKPHPKQSGNLVPYGGVKLDTNKGFYMLKGWPELIVPSSFYFTIREEGKKIMGDSITGIISLSASEWYKKVSKLLQLYIFILKEFTTFSTKRKMWQKFLDQYYSRIWGFGIAKIITMDKNEIIVRLFNSGFAETYIEKGVKTSKPVCDAVRGYMMGWGNLFFGEECSTEETKCIAMGDEFCEFVIRKS